MMNEPMDDIPMSVKSVNSRRVQERKGKNDDQDRSSVLKSLRKKKDKRKY